MPSRYWPLIFLASLMLWALALTQLWGPLAVVVARQVESWLQPAPPAQAPPISYGWNTAAPRDSHVRPCADAHPVVVTADGTLTCAPLGVWYQRKE